MSCASTDYSIWINLKEFYIMYGSPLSSSECRDHLISLLHWYWRPLLLIQFNGPFWKCKCYFHRNFIWMLSKKLSLKIIIKSSYLCILLFGICLLFSPLNIDIFQIMIVYFWEKRRKQSRESCKNCLSFQLRFW